MLYVAMSEQWKWQQSFEQTMIYSQRLETVLIY